MAKLLYQGHASFRLTAENGTILYIDPYAGSGYDVPADAVLVSHEHGDHNRVELVRRKAGCRVLRAADFLGPDGYRSLSAGGAVVRGVPAENRNHSPRECVGFRISLDRVELYFACDTSATAYMREVLARETIDYAFYPTDGVYNMDAEEAARCADLVGAKHNIPIHTKPGALFDEKVAARFRPQGRLLLFPGDEIELVRD